jgi:hypothetical protein
MAIHKSYDQEQADSEPDLSIRAEQLLNLMKAHADNDVRTFGAFIEEAAPGSSLHSRQHTLDITLGSLAAARSCFEGIALAHSAVSSVKKSAAVRRGFVCCDDARQPYCASHKCGY